MEGKLSKVAQTLTPSPIQELSRLAQLCGAINLAEGFPDFPAPDHIKLAAIEAINADLNQYRHVQGVCELVAARIRESQGLDVNPATDVVICCGQSEAFAATMFANPPHWSLNVEMLMKSFTRRTKALVLNSPHNPTGKVFTKEELEAIAAGCCDRDCFAVTDEVYEYITFDMNKHISLASLPGMKGRTIITSSLSKTFSVTGWRIGWACAAAEVASAIRNIHIKITDSAPAPFQEAALTALESPPTYLVSLKKDYEAKKDYMVEILSRLGFQIRFKPQGSVFVFAELPVTWLLPDVDFVRDLIEKAGVAAVPGCGFFHTLSKGENYQNRYVRFAFCKSDATLSAAAQKLQGLVNYNGFLQLN